MKNSKTKFWKWKNQTDEEGTQERVLEFYGTIAEESWFDDDITPEMFREELFADKGPVTIWINSPGGDCNAASQIYTSLMDYKDDVTVKIDGMAASAASVIAMAGTKVLMAPTAMMMMLHRKEVFKSNASRLPVPYMGHCEPLHRRKRRLQAPRSCRPKRKSSRSGSSPSAA